MRTITTFVLVGLVGIAVSAQTPAPAANPVSDSLRQTIARDGKSLIGSAQLMPEDKYGYHPTPDQMTFGHLVMHVAQSNAALCQAISGLTPPDFASLKETDPKAPLVKAITDSFDFCTTALAKVTDAQLGDEVAIRTRKVTRATAMITLAMDLADHYSQAAGYLRLNGILPPTAQRGRGGE